MYFSDSPCFSPLGATGKIILGCCRTRRAQKDPPLIGWREVSCIVLPGYYRETWKKTSVWWHQLSLGTRGDRLPRVQLCLVSVRHGRHRVNPLKERELLHVVLCLEEPFYLLSLAVEENSLRSVSTLSCWWMSLTISTELFYVQCLPAMSLEYGGHTLMLCYCTDNPQLLDCHQWSWKCFARKGLHPCSWSENWAIEEWLSKGHSAMQGQNYSAESRSLGLSRSGWCLCPIYATGVILDITKANSEHFLCCSGSPSLA